MKITHISISRKSTWENCKESYKFRYELEMPSPEPEKFYFIYGKLIHCIAEHYCKNKGEISIGEIARNVLDGKISLERNKEANGKIILPEEYKKRFPENLRVLQSHFEQTGTDGLLEWDFKFDLCPDKTGKYLVGFIDRIIQRGGKIFLIDYKTTVSTFWQKNSQTIKKDLQLRAYARIVSKHFDVKPENIRCALLYLEQNKIVDAKFSEESLIAAEKELLHGYNEILNTHPDNVRGNVGQHCTRCDYRRICPFYSLI